MKEVKINSEILKDIDLFHSHFKSVNLTRNVNVQLNNFTEALKSTNLSYQGSEFTNTNVVELLLHTIFSKEEEIVNTGFTDVNISYIFKDRFDTFNNVSNISELITNDDIIHSLSEVINDFISIFISKYSKFLDSDLRKVLMKKEISEADIVFVNKSSKRKIYTRRKIIESTMQYMLENVDSLKFLSLYKFKNTKHYYKLIKQLGISIFVVFSDTELYYDDINL